MYEKHCRYCNTRLRSDKGWNDNFCCADHRTKFHDRQHADTVERLRREELAESELAVHNFEPRRVRVAMLSGSDRGTAPPPISNSASISSISLNSFAGTGRSMPPQVRVQPLVAPALQPKASVEQGLAALSSIAEPVSEPLQIPPGYLNASPVAPPVALGVGLGATVRRAAPAMAKASKNDALVNLIRGAKARTPQIEVAAEPLAPVQTQAPTVPSPVLKAHAARLAALRPKSNTAAPAQTALPKFLSGEPDAGSQEGRWTRIGLQVGAAVVLLGGAGAYLLLAGH